MIKVHEWHLRVQDVDGCEFFLEKNGFWNYAVEKTAYSVIVKIFTNDEAFVMKVAEETGAQIIGHSLSEPKDWYVYLDMKPFYVAPNVVVDPTCKLRKPRGAVLIKMWPSAAFGTGDHPTTKLVAQLMVENIKSINSLLDVGCGTGILAIIAKKLGVEKVVAVDNDSMALEVAKDFAKTNKVDIDLRLSDLLSAVDEIFDMVVANINTVFCLRLMEQVHKVSHKNTLMILSGIPENEGETVVDFAKSQGFDVIGERGFDGWKAFLMRIL